MRALGVVVLDVLLDDRAPRSNLDATPVREPFSVHFAERDEGTHRLAADGQVGRDSAARTSPISRRP
jgi:hypothetical protein